MLTSRYEDSPFDAVHSTDKQSTYLTAKYLLTLGHERFAYVGGPCDASVEINRRNDFCLAMKEANIFFDENYCFEMGFSEDAGYKFGRHFLSLDPKPTAVCCANDLIAKGVIRFFREHMIAVPYDVSVTGIDNIDVGEETAFRLTTVDQNVEELVERMMQLLIDRLEGSYEGPPREVIVNRRLILGNSTCAPHI